MPLPPPGSQYATQAGLEMAILLPLPLEFWGYRHVTKKPGLIS